VPAEEPLGDHGTDYCGYCHNFGHRAGNDCPNEPRADEPHDASSIEPAPLPLPRLSGLSTSSRWRARARFKSDRRGAQRLPYAGSGALG
jgi:hypothetical protein